MKISKKPLFRKYEGALFHSDTSSREDRVYGFYLLMRPLLGWVKSALLEKGLLAAEAESELFLLCESLFSRYNKHKGSLIPYLEEQTPWQVSEMLAKVNKYMCHKEIPKGLITLDGQYTLNEEFYWAGPNILFEDRYVGKSFTRSIRYVIFTVLVADDKKLSMQNLAETLGLCRHTIKSKLNEIKETLIKENYIEKPLYMEESND